MLDADTMIVGVIDADIGDDGVILLLVSGDDAILSAPHRPVLVLHSDDVPALQHCWPLAGLFWVGLPSVTGRLRPGQIYQIRNLAERRKKYGYTANIDYKWSHSR